MKKLFIGLSALALFAISCKHDPAFSEYDRELTDLMTSRAPNGSIRHFILPEADDYANIPQDPRNPLTKEKIELGKMLYYETGVGIEAKHSSGFFTFSCSSCHIPEAGFRPNRHQGIADGAIGFGVNGEARIKNPEYADSEIDAQGARPLSMLNVAFVKNTMWNGSFGPFHHNVGTESQWGKYDPGTSLNHLGYEALEAQNIAGLEVHRLVYNKQIIATYGYTSMFDAAFPDWDEERRYSREAASLAISAYLRQLLCTEAPLQRWLKGEEDALSEEQKRGGILFFGKAGCWRCHYEPNLGSMDFHALGVTDLYENGGLKTSADDRRNLGRGGFTDRPEDMFKFRVPQLYNMGDAPFFFHGASKKNLRDVVEYFNNGVPENSRIPKSQISTFFHPLNLTNQEMVDLEAFIRDGLRDPNLKRYVPEVTLSGMCFPNNDPQSRKDKGCE